MAGMHANLGIPLTQLSVAQLRALAHAAEEVCDERISSVMYGAPVPDLKLYVCTANAHRETEWAHAEALATAISQRDAEAALKEQLACEVRRGARSSSARRDWRGQNRELRAKLQERGKPRSGRMTVG